MLVCENPGEGGGDGGVCRGRGVVGLGQNSESALELTKLLIYCHWL